MAKSKNVEQPVAEPAGPPPVAAQLGKIRKNLLDTIGMPGNLFRVQVNNVWGNSYRVNIFLGDSSSSTIAQSYFLKATDEGQILSSIPALKREYR